MRIKYHEMHTSLYDCDRAIFGVVAALVLPLTPKEVVGERWELEVEESDIGLMSREMAGTRGGTGRPRGSTGGGECERDRERVRESERNRE